MTKKRLNFQPFLQKNKLHNLIVTERGLGKTFRLKRKAIDDFLKNGTKFIYLRRRKPELKLIRQFFDDIKFLYPDHKLEVKGWTFYIDGKECGQALLLNRYQDYKSAPFPDYNLIIFDEFIREKVESVGYLDDEVSAFLSICDSVFRDRHDVHTYLLANSISIVNPYFVEFQINVDPKTKYQKSFIKEINDFVLCYVQHKDFNDIEEEINDPNRSEFRRFVDLTNYGKMANNNEFSADDKTFLAKRSKDSTFKFQIKINGKVYGLWNDKRLQLLYVSEKTDPTTKLSYCFDPKDKKENDILIRRFNESYHTMKLVQKFKKNQLRFEEQHIKSEMLGNFARLGIY